MKLYIAFIFLISLSLFAQDSDDNVTQTDSIKRNSENIITIKDTSGVSKEELRDKALKEDKKVQKDVVSDAIVNTYIKKKEEAVWEKLAPTPVKYDWIELKSGEWLKGKFKAMYSKKLEFDSDKLKLLTFDFKDVYQLRSYNIMTVRIQTQEEQLRGFFDIQKTTVQASGIIRMDREKIKIIQGKSTLEFPRSQIISIAFEGKSSFEHWSVKATLSFNAKDGNTKQIDYTANVRLQRRTASSRLRFDYIGNITDVSEKETTNNHRVNETLNLYITKDFFVTPISAEYFHDIYQNIESQWTVGAALGHSIIDTKKIDWSISIGPAAVRTYYDTVEEGNNIVESSWAVQLATYVDIEITKNMDLILDYTFTKLSEESGGYKHHTVTKLENDITKWLDFDITLIWDYLDKPTAKEDGSVPYKNDTQLLLGIGVDF
jgi:putative salt-induced outer membrane protein YdiY